MWSIERLLASGVSTPAMLTDPSVERTALLAWWDRETLMSPAARAAWLAPATRDADGDVPKEWLQPELSIT